MIKYRLRCGREHEFEAWFKDSGAYDEQATAGVVECPYCGDDNVTKALMAPSLARRRAATASSEDPSEARARQVARKILDAVEAIREHVEEHSEYVGDAFAQEAKAIHAGEAEIRDIYGEATDAEVRELDDEGIQYLRLPVRPRRNS